MSKKEKKQKVSEEIIVQDVIDLETEPDAISDDSIEEEADKAIKKHKAKKKIAISLGIIFGVLAIAYIGLSIFFTSHFFFNTTINGTSYSCASVASIEEEIKAGTSDYTLMIRGSNGINDFIYGSDIDLSYAGSESFDVLLKQQNPFLWIMSLVNQQELTAEIQVDYDESKLNAKISELYCMQEENQEASVNAHPEFEDTKFVPAEATIGTVIDEEAMKTAVGEAVANYQSELILADANVYEQPEYTIDDPEVLEACEAMNKYLGAEITYDLSPDTEVIDAEQIGKWIVCSNKTLEVKFSTKRVKKYIKQLASRVDTLGKDRKFTTATGDTVTVEGGDFGWKIDQDKEYETLIANIKNGDVVTREPEYSSRGVTHGDLDIGSTYAEVDLTKQHMYFIKDGEIKLESDIVTGNPNKGNATPQGTYDVTYTARNATLKGEKLADGSYSYETPVAYWMPFNAGIGFHDATWQSSFGGEGYKTHGSHGCVNMPKEKAAALFDLIYTGCPVVCHY